ncbi:MAG TPA: FAD-dependent monooxygenase [Stellaceae bacterium]|nr:FAD-dependent monooxygenase [Stellaceae bacterium]
MPRTPRVAIIGAGIGGLAAAVALHRRGVEVEVYEQSSKLSEIGAGLNLSPNAIKAFRALGLEQEVAAIGFESDFQVIRNWRNGHVISRQARKGRFSAQFGAPHLTLHRADLLEVLSRPLPDRVFRLGARCVAVEPGGNSARAFFADGSTIEADVVVGADGIRSAVRTSLFGPEAPRFTGCVCWRGLVPFDAVPRGLIASDGTMYMGPHGHVVHYLVRRGEMVNFVAHFDSDAWTEESWTHECDRAEVLKTYARWHEPLLRLFECADHYYKWALYDRDPPAHWSQGRATLLGDSAHAMLPYLGQGACMAIEDGYILAAAIAAMPDDLGRALQEYQRLRMPRAHKTVLGSRARAKENHLASPWARLKRNAKIALRGRLGIDRTVFQADWLYTYDVAAEARFAG